MHYKYTLDQRFLTFFVSFPLSIISLYPISPFIR